MTKEELEKEASEYAMQYAFYDANNISVVKEVKDAYLEGFNKCQEENENLKEFIDNLDLSVEEVKRYWDDKKFEYTEDDTNSLDPNTWGVMHEDYAIPMYVAMEGIRNIIAENMKLNVQIEQLKAEIEKSNAMDIEDDWGLGN